MFFNKLSKIYINSGWDHLPTLDQYFDKNDEDGCYDPFLAGQLPAAGFDNKSNYHLTLLTKKRQEFIQQLTPDQIKNVEVDGDIWYNDDLPAWDVHITFTNLDILSFAACDLTPECIGMFHYPDSKMALEQIVKYIKDNMTC